MQLGRHPERSWTDGVQFDHAICEFRQAQGNEQGQSEMWICDEEIGSRCGKDDDVILKIFRCDVADGQSGYLKLQLTIMTVERFSRRETSVTHSNNPVNSKCDEVQVCVGFILCGVKMMSLHEYPERILASIFTCMFCNSRTSRSVREELRDTVAIRQRGRRRRDRLGARRSSCHPCAWQQCPFWFVPSLTLGKSRELHLSYLTAGRELYQVT